MLRLYQKASLVCVQKKGLKLMFISLYLHILYCGYRGYSGIRITCSSSCLNAAVQIKKNYVQMLFPKCSLFIKIFILNS